MVGLAKERYLFRGISTRTNDWVEGCYIRDVDRDDSLALNEFAHKIQPLYSQAWAHPVRPETISQYTGMLDKNKQKIWENDIVMELLYGKYKHFYKIVYNELDNMNCNFYNID